MDLRINGLASVANSGDTQGMEGQMQNTHGKRNLPLPLPNLYEPQLFL